MTRHLQHGIQSPEVEFIFAKSVLKAIRVLATFDDYCHGAGDSRKLVSSRVRHYGNLHHINALLIVPLC